MQQEEELDVSKNERQGRSLYSLRRRTQVLIRNCSACLRAKQGSRKVEGGNVGEEGKEEGDSEGENECGLFLALSHF